jgi:alcohol dehydrogenase class IV
MRFVHDTLPQRVVFATGGAAGAVADEVSRLGAGRVMLIASRRSLVAQIGSVAQIASVAQIGAGLPVVLRHDEVVMHVPVDVALRARAAADAHDVDAIVCVGGGSATGLAKAVAMYRRVPIVAVPTTYAGSEATPVWGLTEGGTKTTGVDTAVLPRAVVYDAALLASLPVDLAVASGLNALAHGVDSMWAPRADPINQALAGEGIRALASGLSTVVAEPSSLVGIEETLYGAYLAAVAFASAGSGLHHKICHVLGGMFGLPHAQTHAVVLPHVLAFNVPAAPEAAHRIARALGAASATAGLAALRERLDAPRALAGLGMPEDGISRAVGPILAAAPPDNSTPVTPSNLSLLLRRAWAGEEPQ